MDMVQDLLRATAAEVLSRFDEWNLKPARPWLTAARRLAGAGLLPIPKAYEPAAHLAEYRSLLPNYSFRVEAGLNERPDSFAVGFETIERSLLWVSELLNAEVLFFVPDERSASQIRLDGEAGEPEIIARPLRGKPHPLSVSEQKMSRYIAADTNLAELFEWNSYVRLSPLSNPCVDLLWAEGKLVVEIDDQSHWRKDKYAADRQRDFELTMSGFMVLRITSEEVLSDTAKTIEKIRRCVELRRVL
jgi:very-short-patch-repair endonuclease